MNRIMHAVSIRAPRRRMYDALATLQWLAGRWTTTVTGESAVGGTLAFRFAEVFKPVIPPSLLPNGLMSV